MKRLILIVVMVFACSSLYAEDWHVKATSPNGRASSVIFHIPVPSGNNSASPAKSWQDAVAEYIKPRLEDGSFGTWTSSLQGIAAGELTSLQAGSLIEVQKSVKFLTLDTDLQKSNKIDAKFMELTTEYVNEFKTILKFWGYTRDVP